jgi:superfamily II RNA helicase
MATIDPIPQVVAPPPIRPTLASRLPPGGTQDPAEILSLFLQWVEDVGFEPYPAQEEALLELMQGKHVILSTPTGSGKSLVALGLHFKALCEGRRCYYTSPVKALASEKFFSLCEDLGAENVGMQTGDASINSKAPIICCTAEVLSNLALRRGAAVDAPYVVMDEFHYYADPERGVAWQVPLITLPRTQFLLMSATLGDMRDIEAHLRRQTDREPVTIASDQRPVPLYYEYRETPLHETVNDLIEQGRTPAYIVCFTQREAAELAQSLTSFSLASKREREEIREHIGDFHFDTPYGKTVRRMLDHGVGIHHAGLLPKYRLLVEQLSQRGLLEVICGTDTLGVGVNIPIRTVVFTQLSKFDGTETAILKVRDFKQIAGRAGRKGFDEEGWVVCQAPEHVIENKRRERRAKGGKRGAKVHRKAPPRDRFVAWDEKTFQSLVKRPPETLRSQFRMSNSMVLSLLQQDAEHDDPDRPNFASLRETIERSHESPARKRELLSTAAAHVRSLYRTGVLGMTKDSQTNYRWVVVNEDLQFNFSLHQQLSLFLVETIERLDPTAPDYALDVLTLAESVLENPMAVLYRQSDVHRDELNAKLKAQGMPFEERIERLDKVTWPKPKADFVYEEFDRFRRIHPWVGSDNIRPKSIGRDMFETYAGFNDYVRRYGLERSEGLLLRYLSQLYKTVTQSVPRNAVDSVLLDIKAFLRTTVEHTDASLLEEWEAMVHPELRLERREEAEKIKRAMRDQELLGDPRAFAARVRAELHYLVRALAHHDWEEAVASVRPPDDGGEPWTEDRFQQALAPFLALHGELDFSARARGADLTRIDVVQPRVWSVRHTLVDPQGDDDWALEGLIDLRRGKSLESPLFQLGRIGT